MRKILFLLLTSALLPILAKSSSADVALKAIWQPGSQMVYDTNIDGNLSLQVPASAQSMIAGMPLEISLRGTGKTMLNTLKVNDFGDGTVTTKINPLNLEFETFGQKAVIKVNNGVGIMMLNGAPQSGSFIDWNLVTNPPVAVTFSPQMKVTDVASTNTADAKASVNSAMPTGVVAMMQNLFLQSLPAALPANSLKVGDKWTSEVQFKTSPAADVAAINLGSFQFELKDPQTMEGRSLQHIVVHGDLDLTSEQSKSLMAATASPGANTADPAEGASSESSKLFTSMLADHTFSFGQSVDGDLYFDAVAGQFIQANLNIDSEMQTMPKSDGPSTPDGFFNFHGTMRFKLTNVIKSPQTP